VITTPIEGAYLYQPARHYFSFVSRFHFLCFCFLTPCQNGKTFYKEGNFHMSTSNANNVHGIYKVSTRKVGRGSVQQHDFLGVVKAGTIKDLQEANLNTVPGEEPHFEIRPLVHFDSVQSMISHFEKEEQEKLAKQQATARVSKVRTIADLMTPEERQAVIDELQKSLLASV
jgi:hypothetical protein